MSKNNEQDADAKAKADAEAARLKKEAEDAANQNDDDKKDQNQDDSSSKDKIDYKAIAEEEKRKRIEAEQAIAKAKLDKKRKADDNNSDDDDDQDDDNKPITRKDIQAIVQAERQTVTKELYADRINEIARELSESDDEANAIVEVHKSRTFPGHLSLREQLEEIHAIVNRKRLISKNAELARANKSKDTASNDSAGTYRDGQEGTAPKMSDSDTKAYSRAGFTYDTKDKLWKKKLPNGNSLIKDPKTKVTYVRPK